VLLNRNPIFPGNKIIILEKEYVYEDSKKIYAREPYIAHFMLENSMRQKSLDFWMVGLHLRPASKNDLFKEAFELRSVVDQIKKNDADASIVIMGDMNFDCTYIDKTSRYQIKTRLNDFTFYIEDGVRTTMSNVSCALDRILVNKGQLSKIVASYGPYYYDKYMNLESEVGLDFD